MEDSEKGWELGQPNADFFQAHSGANAWGSNLDVDWISQEESFLISPAILLTGGNQATLRFWQTYDFSMPLEFDIFHGGELLLITNTAVNPITLPLDFTQDSNDWQQVEIDLTPYLGQIVYVVWHYALFAFDSWPRPGWLVDDVSVDIKNTEAGTIAISNNLAQASFALHGPISRSGTGWSLLITNAPPGSYWVTYDSVPDYETPASQTNSLAAEGSVWFQGNYTFADVNSNGISDAWEQFYFPTNWLDHTALTDSDGDGFPDGAEFVAGTDPLSPNSMLDLNNPIMVADGSVRLAWSAAAGRAYQVEGSSDAVTWRPLGDWQRADSTNLTVTLPPAVVGGDYLFRLQVRP